MFVSSLTFFHESSGLDVATGVDAGEVVTVITGLVLVGETGEEGCSVVQPAANRSAARTMPAIRNDLTDDICFRLDRRKK
jgi:hypothetical protein